MARKQAPLAPLIIGAGPSQIALPRLPVMKWIMSGDEAVGISTSVASLSYDHKLRLLYVTFHGYRTKPGVTYFYYGVSPFVARDFYHANSLGLFVQRRLEPFFYYQKL